MSSSEISNCSELDINELSVVESFELIEVKLLCCFCNVLLSCLNSFHCTVWSHISIVINQLSTNVMSIQCKSVEEGVIHCSSGGYPLVLGSDDPIMI